jgi:hypothetical protein
LKKKIKINTAAAGGAAQQQQQQLLVVGGNRRRWKVTCTAQDNYGIPRTFSM